MTTDNQAQDTQGFRIRVQVVLAPVRGIFVQMGDKKDGVIVNEASAESIIAAFQKGLETLREIGGATPGYTALLAHLGDNVDGEGGDVCRS